MEAHSARIVSLNAVTRTLTQQPFNCEASNNNKKKSVKKTKNSVWQVS